MYFGCYIRAGRSWRLVSTGSLRQTVYVDVVEVKMLAAAAQVRVRR